MGCEGCELWLPEPAFLNLATRILSQIAPDINSPRKAVQAAFEATRTRFQFARALGELVQDINQRQHLISELDRAAACYAGVLATARAGYSSGYPDHFEHPTLYPGRVEKMARCAGVTQRHADKVWLKGMPFMIFVSDMGDALSKSISFTELDHEIIQPVSGADGRRHVWLCSIKRFYISDNLGPAGDKNPQGICSRMEPDSAILNIKPRQKIPEAWFGSSQSEITTLTRHAGRPSANPAHLETLPRIPDVRKHALARSSWRGPE